MDHCCGDGFFASLAWENQKSLTGCDLSESSIALAGKFGIYQRLDVCDASRSLPYRTATFDLIFNNSALEHILDLDGVLTEVSRVLKPGGEFAFNVLNHRYFEWWPLDELSRRAYREWQPFYHALSISDWSDRLEQAGLTLTVYKGYFDCRVSQRFAELDYWFSGYFIRKQLFPFVIIYLKLKFLMARILERRFRNLDWEAEPDGGAGYFIRALKRP